VEQRLRRCSTAEGLRPSAAGRPLQSEKAFPFYAFEIFSKNKIPENSCIKEQSPP